jgi:hypothetical protein
LLDLCESYGSKEFTTKFKPLLGPKPDGDNNSKIGLDYFKFSISANTVFGLHYTPKLFN